MAKEKGMVAPVPSTSSEILRLVQNEKRGVLQLRLTGLIAVKRRRASGQ